MRVFIANRGEIAVRILHSCARLGYQTVLGVSSTDRDSTAARMADRVVVIGGPRPADSYLRAESVVHAALATGCDMVHPGYGFLSENADFAQLCRDEGLTFVGPRPEHLRQLGDKWQARGIAAQAGLSVVPGGQVNDLAQAIEFAASIGYPLIIKAAFGGGGRGMRLVGSAAQMPAAFELATGEAAGSFGDGTVFLERYLGAVKHVEVQVARDRRGTSRQLGERDCSAQYRYQKVVEETPCAGLPQEHRQRLHADALRLADWMDFENVGTVEFLVSIEAGEHWFIEVNPRLQVEHPVTEQVTGVDLVELQFALARGEAIDSVLPRSSAPTGHAIECRVTAQDPDAELRPSPGEITHWRPPAGSDVRVDTHGYEGYLFPPYYDALLAKVVTHANTREQAREAMLQALADFQVAGIATNLTLLGRIIGSEAFQKATVTTDWLTSTLLGADGDD